MATAHQDSIHIARDPKDYMVRGFEIHLGSEDVTVFLPFSSIKPHMPEGDQRLLEQSAEGFLRRYGPVMISTARSRLSEGELGTPEDLERFEATEKMREDLSELSPEQAEVLASLRGTSGGHSA